MLGNSAALEASAVVNNKAMKDRMLFILVVFQGENPVVPTVADPKGSVWRNGDAVRTVELGSGSVLPPKIVDTRLVFGS